MSYESPVSIANLAKWATVLMLFVVCGCLLINVRAQHTGKRNKINELKQAQVSVLIAVQNVEADIKRNLAPRVLEARLQAYHSDLAPVSVERTEALIPDMTASR